MVANVHPSPKRTFVPAELVINDFADVEPLYRELLERPIGSPAELEAWLGNLSELTEVVYETRTRRYVDKSCHTDNPAIEAAFLKFVEQIEPPIKPLFFQLQKKFVESPHRAGLTAAGCDILARHWQADVEIFREQNVPLQTESEKLINEYDKICGAMMISFRGREYTPQQMGRFLEEPDRATRQEAWIATTERRMRDRAAMEDIFDKLLAIRGQIAANTGLPDYRAYIWKEKKRFDYTPEDCLRFADSVAETVMPLLHELDDRRAPQLGIPRQQLRPWDLSVDPLNRPPLRPFAESEIDAFVSKTQAIFDRLSPPLAEDFRSLGANGNLDLDSRKGKQPGGYLAEFSEKRQPFIFMNAAGLQGDVDTLLHEAGHAFHSLATRDHALMFLREAPMEFSEVASMAMELFGAEHLDVFYSPADHSRARRMHLEGIIKLLPWIALIDSFQHWLYTNPGHTRRQRTGEWLRLLDRFTSRTDWTGFEEARAALWQKQLHLFHVPFYYIEYGIAQLGALQLWIKSKENPRQALSNYRAALALGGMRPLPELFAAAGIRFDFSDQTLRPLMNAVREELESMPE